MFAWKLTGLKSANKISVAEASFTMIINALILYGLQKRKQWVVSLVLFFSAWTLLSNFIRVVGGTGITTTDMMKQKIGSLIFALFSIYQLYVFRKSSTSRFEDERIDLLGKVSENGITRWRHADADALVHPHLVGPKNKKGKNQ